MSQLTFQDTILQLQNYWKERGCIVRNPYNVQVGAGTMNPATVLRVLGPEPWNVVYVEPSVRPDDGRFGDNPNRVQMHHQLQVILKPDPGNPQQLYLDSLRAIGIDPREHDIRFVEDNWESPALGAWGLGWEVWLDGQEISQYTYFQQSGSTNLDPVCVELTYGLDRIILALQNKDSVWEIDYNDRISYGDVLLQSEIEHCKYYFNVADVDALREVYDTYERESQRCIDAGLVIPAHDYNLKCSHLFNVLDTRGAIGVTERANYFKRMRGKAKQISELYIEQRQRMEFPLLDEGWTLASEQEAVSSEQSGSPVVYGGEEAQTFVLEIGQEELPSDDLIGAIRQLRIEVPELLQGLRLTYDSVEVDGTPRRIAVIVKGLAPRQSDLEEIKKGPPAARAYDKDGNPTKAAIGFARGKKVRVEDLILIDEGRYVAAQVREEGRPTPDVLAEALPKLVSGIKFNKSMRWNASNIAYSRPIRWFIALFGSQIVPFTYADVPSGNVSRGLRPYDSPPITISSADEYEDLVAKNNIILRTDQRSQMIFDGAAELAESINGTIPEDAGLLAEVTNLVEAPTAFIGRFAPRYLDLPSELLVAVMRKHQRYFPVYAQDGSLINAFIAIRNGDSEHIDIVRHGNEQVVRARFADAEFFFGSDSKRELPDFIADLDKLTFQFKLGSMKDKLHRLEKLTPQIAEAVGLSKEDSAIAAQAASLSKADLATKMVVEMTSLQGIMGGYYAKMSGASEAVSMAIAEQYNAVSKTPAGLALALADRLDSLVGLTAAGLLPKGTNDPFALRRAAIQIIENLIGNQVSVDLRTLVEKSAETQPIPAHDSLPQVLDFINGRLEQILRDSGYPASVIRAVLAHNAHDPYIASTTAAALTAATQLDDWEQTLDAYARCVRITRKEADRHPVNPDAFVTEEAKALHTAYQAVVAKSDSTVETFVAQIRDLTPAISTFFDEVLVMDEDMAVRNNRLGLLQSIASLADGIGDLSELEGF